LFLSFFIYKKIIAKLINSCKFFPNRQYFHTQHISILISFAIVKKAFAILLLTTYMFSTTEFYQLLKIPVLVTHFLEHKARHPQISVWNFLTQHYEGDHLRHHPNNDDYDQDQKLPFMSHINLPNTCCVPSQPLRFEIKTKSSQIRKQKMPAFDENYANNHFLSAVWQPPRCSQHLVELA